MDERDLLGRVERLERQNRSLRLGLLAALGAAALLPGRPSGAHDPASPLVVDRIVAKEIEVRDQGTGVRLFRGGVNLLSGDEVRASLTLLHGGSSLALNGAHGYMRLDPDQRPYVHVREPEDPSAEERDPHE